MPAMYGVSSRLMGFACEARDRARKETERQPDASPGDAAVAIIMSVVAAEAFINELAEAAVVFNFNTGGDEQGAADSPAVRLANLARLLERVEDEHGGLLLKYHIASQALTGRTFDPGRNPFQDFQTLVKVRNLLTHFRCEGTFQYDAHGRITGYKHPKLVEQLQQRGLARRSKPNTVDEWSSTLMTGEMAGWACQTALEMVFAVANLLPGGLTKMFCLPWAMMRETQRGK
jgi:hypothetical protein